MLLMCVCHLDADGFEHGEALPGDATEQVRAQDLRRRLAVVAREQARRLPSAFLCFRRLRF
jgi:hypothetical protein